MGRIALEARMLTAAAQPALGRDPRDPKTLYAACDRRGVIETLDQVPDGLLGIIAGTPDRVREIVSATARHAHDGKTLLVPGIPEAETDEEAFDALLRFRAWLRRRHPRMVARAAS